MDEHTLRVLEFDRVKEALAQHAASEMGEAHARALAPLTQPEGVRARLAETTECRALMDESGRLPLGGLKDCTQFVRTAAAGGALRAEELVEVVDTLQAIRRLRDSVMNRAERCPKLAVIAADLSTHPVLEQQIARCIGDRGEILDSASPALGSIRSAVRVTRGRLTQRMEAVLRNPAYRLMIQDPVVVQRGGRACVPIKQDFRGQFPGLVHDQSSSGQTVFMEPTETLEVANEVRRLELDEQAEIHRILLELSAAVGAQGTLILRSLKIAGILDFIHARASYSRELGAVAPRPAADGQVLLRQARHPLLSGDVVPLDLELGDNCRTVVITGPNTGGKTVALKTVGLLALMAQSGLHIPAAPDSRLPIFPEVFADIGDEQSIAQSLSTFSAHLRQIVKIVHNLERGTLVLLDELGAGTDPVEGSALASTLLEHLTEADARTIVTTHFGELKELAYRVPGIENASMQFDEETLQPTYALQMGVPGRSLALVIAGRLGLPEELVNRARERVSQEERSVGEMLRSLEEDRREAAEARRHAEADERAAARLRDMRQREFDDLDRRRREILEKAAVDAQKAVREAREQAREILADLRKRAHAGGPTHQATEALGAMDRQLTEVRQKIEDRPRAPRPAAFKPTVGAAVHVPRFGQNGTIVEVGSDDQISVAVGNLRVRLPADELQPTTAAPASPARAPGHKLRMQKAAEVPPELMLLGLRTEEAVEKLDKYLDDAMLSGVPSVRVIHGKGTGALKSAVWEWLRGHPAVQSYRIGVEGEGGAGATVVELVHD